MDLEKKRLIGIILSIVFLVLTTFLITNTFNEFNKIDDNLICKQSILLNSKLEKLTGREVKYECKSEINDVTKLNQEETFDFISNEMKQCNSLFDYGKSNIFPNAPSGKTICAICSYNKINLNHDYSKFDDFVFKNNRFKNIFGIEHYNNNKQLNFFNLKLKDENMAMIVKFTKVSDDFADVAGEGVLNYVSKNVAVKSLIGAFPGLVLMTFSALSPDPISKLALSGEVALIGAGAISGAGYGIIQSIDNIVNSKEIFFTTIFIGDLDISKLSSKEIGCDKVIF